jgi:pyruvate,water dikinase
MVRPRAAGVMFTLDPVTGDRSKIVIEGVPGLGEALVSGEATPDRFRVDKVTLEILAREPASAEEPLCLGDDAVRELATLAKRIERHRKAPMDIEWAVDERGGAHVLQVRPETVWSRREAKKVSAGASAMDLVMSRFMGGRKP